VTACASLLLTGGASRRMGRDKATLEVAGVALAKRTAGLLGRACAPVVEVGPGVSGLAWVREDPAGAGPLAAVAAGAVALAGAGWSGPALVVATDLPRLTAGLVAWLAGHPAPGSVVPCAEGRPQPLCARWSGPDLARAVELVAGGARSMGDLLRATRPDLVGPGDWGPAAGDPLALADADTPDDLAALR
jgi:molybdopterin-guanine dinucleotide biosynthesis protein A